jgi:hypothetical protein
MLGRAFLRSPSGSQWQLVLLTSHPVVRFHYRLLSKVQFPPPNPNFHQGPLKSDSTFSGIGSTFRPLWWTRITINTMMSAKIQNRPTNKYIETVDQRGPRRLILLFNLSAACTARRSNRCFCRRFASRAASGDVSSCAYKLAK